jgi:hypothetical protein
MVSGKFSLRGVRPPAVLLRETRRGGLRFAATLRYEAGKVNPQAAQPLNNLGPPLLSGYRGGAIH